MVATVSAATVLFVPDPLELAGVGVDGDRIGGALLISFVLYVKFM